MKKEGYRLPSTRQEYDANSETTIWNETNATVGRLLPIKTFRDMQKECVDMATVALEAEVLADQDEARMRHDNQMWNVWQTQYETEWWRYQERGC